jgi:molybdopterin synthase sulfur carrier subunit
MTTTVFIPGPLRDRCGGKSRLTVEAATVGAALAAIERLHPSLYAGICDDTGAVRRHVNVFVNSANIRDREGLDTVLAERDEVIILPSVSGG